MKELETHEKDQLAIMRLSVENAGLRVRIAQNHLQLKQMAYDYYVMALYKKYGLKDSDNIDEEGIIHRTEESEKNG